MKAQPRLKGLDCLTERRRRDAELCASAEERRVSKHSPASADFNRTSAILRRFWRFLGLVFAQAIDIACLGFGEAAESGCSADQGYFLVARSVNNSAPPCFCAMKFARRTARSIATGASSRTSASSGGRVVQRHVLYLGEINDSQELAWRKSIEVMEEAADRPRTLSLFPEDRCEGLLPDASIVRLRLSQLRLCRPRQWGACWLALTLWEELELDRFWAARLPVSRKGTRWDRVLFVLVAYRLLAPGSEWRLHREWFERTALADLLGADFGLAEIHKLYRCHDRLLEHKQALFDHLTGRWRDLFNVRFDVLLYDLTSTYFEADPPFPEGDKRRYGYSRDHRPDCVQVVIALVVTPEGLPLAYEVLPGNTADKTTLRDFLEQDRAAIRQGPAHLVDGPRHPDRGDAGRDARGRSAGALPGRHAEGTADRLERHLLDQALAAGPPGRAGQALAARRRTLRLRREPRPRRQGARHAPAPAEMAVGAPQATLADATDARRAADETRRARKAKCPTGVALGPVEVDARAPPSPTASTARQAAASAPARRAAICCAPISPRTIRPSCGTSICSWSRSKKRSRT